MENDAKRKKKNKCFSMRKHYDFDKFWKPGMPVTEADKKMLWNRIGNIRTYNLSFRR